MKIHLLLFGIALLLPVSSQAIGLAVTNNQCGSITLLSSSVSSAGNYYSATQNCTAAMTVTGITSSVTWTLKAQISSMNTNLPVSVRRTGGGGNLVDGLSFSVLNTIEKDIFTGTGNIADIPLEVQISNIGAEDGNGTIVNNSTISYRVVVD